MRRLVTATVLTILVQSAYAVDGVFDRSSEVEGYILAINTGTRAALIETAGKILDAELGDPRLAKALRDKLFTDLPSLDKESSIDAKYRKLMVLALASTGAAEYGDDVRKACADLKSGSRDTYCDKAADGMKRNKERNEVMASTKHFRAGDDPRVIRVMNLVMSDDFGFMEEAARRISFEKMLDPRLMDAVDVQVQRYTDVITRRSSNNEVNTLAYFVKLLGYSRNEKYYDTLTRVQNSKTDQAVKRHADTALRRLKSSVPDSDE